MPFSYRQFLRQVPAQTMRAFLDCRGVQFDEAVDWTAEEAALAKSLAAAIDGLPDDAGADIIADFERAYHLSDDRGYVALLNAARDREALAARLSELENGQDRALRVLIDDDALFRAAEEIRYFQHYIERSQGRRFQVDRGLEIDRSEGALQRFGEAVGAWFRKRDGSGLAFSGEILDRFDDGSVQVTLYIEDLPSNRPEFEKRQLRRRASRPAKEAAVVYSAATGRLETVAKGGKPVHEALRDLFAEHMLGAEPGGEVILAADFDLSRLLVDRALPVNRRDGLLAARVRLLKLETPRRDQGAFVIETPPGYDSPSAYDFAGTWLGAANPIRTGFDVVEATISVYFERPAGKEPRAVHVKLTRPNGSNTKDLRLDDRALIERYLRNWGFLPGGDVLSDQNDPPALRSA